VLNIVREKNKKNPPKNILKSVSDPYSFDTDPDPAFYCRLNTDPDQDPIRIKGFGQKIEKIYSKKNLICLDHKLP
jgi:hypothetical protein